LHDFNRWGIFVSKKVKFEILFTWQLIFYKQKAKQNNFCVFEELVFFDLQIPVSGFWILVFGSGFWVPDSGLLGFRVAPSLTVCLLHIHFTHGCLIQHRQTY